MAFIGSGACHIGEHVPAARFDFGGFRVLVFVDHVLVGRLHVQAVRMIVHPRAHKSCKIESRVAIQHGLVMHHLVGGFRQTTLLWNGKFRERLGFLRTGEQRIDFHAVRNNAVVGIAAGVVAAMRIVVFSGGMCF